METFAIIQTKYQSGAALLNIHIPESCRKSATDDKVGRYVKNFQ